MRVLGLGAVVVIFAACAMAVAPSQAHAYTDQSIVQEGTKIGTEAEEFLRNEERDKLLFEGGGGEPPEIPEDGGGWWGWGEASGWLPVVAQGTLAFGAGFGIGQEVCENILEPVLEELGSECWHIETEENDPATPEGGHWVYEERGPELSEGGHGPFYAWYWVPGYGGGPSPIIYDGMGGVKAESGCGLKAPPGGSFVQSFFTSCGGEEPIVGQGYVVRSGTENRKISIGPAGALPSAGAAYCPVEAPTKCTEAPSSNWQERAAKCLEEPEGCGISEKHRNEIAEHIAANTPKGEKAHIEDPWEPAVHVECEGLLWAPCKEKLEEHLLKPERKELDWHTAVLTKPANAVIETTPSEGSRAKLGSKIEVKTNPDIYGMPKVVPNINPGETYDEYAKKLEEAGLKGQRVNVTDANEDTKVGPNDAIRTDPEEGTRLDPETTTEVEVFTNPSDAPPAAGGGGGFELPELKSFNLGPLGLKPCGVFPFGLLCWVGEGIDELGESAASCPTFSPHLPSITGGTYSASIDTCEEPFPEIREYMRPAELFFFVLGLGYLFAKATRVFGPE